MSRSTSLALRRAVTAQTTNEAFLVLLKIDYANRLPDLTDAQLRGAWLNSAVGKTPNDYSLALDDLTEIGAPTYPDEGITLDGAADYLRRAEAAWRPDSAGTVVGWVSRASFASADVVFGSCDEATADDIFYVGVRADDTLEVYSETGGVVSAHVRGGTTIATSAETHVAVVSNGTAYLLFVNGALETNVIVAGADNGDWLADVANRDNVTVGARRHSAVADYFDGTLKDVRYYSRALTPADVRAIYQAGLSDPIRLVNNNSHIISNGERYIAFPFELTLPNESDDASTSVSLRVDNVDQQIVTALRQLTTTPTVSVSVVLASDPSTVEAGPFTFSMQRAAYNAGAVTAVLEYEDVLREQIPGDSFSPAEFPGVFAGVS